MNLRWYQSLEWFSKTKKVRKILFVCSGNTCRSPAAVYYFKQCTHWWSGISAFSRGTQVNKILKEAAIKKLRVPPESKQVIGDRESIFLKRHAATQIAAQDVLNADVVLTMTKFLRDELRSAYPDSSYKIFTLKGFVNADDDSNTTIDIEDPFNTTSISEKNDVNYYRYQQNYSRIFTIIQANVRKLVEIIYLLKSQKRS